MNDQALQHGVALFNVGRYFDAHEALEDVWRMAAPRSRRRRHLQGLVQVAVAFHHQSTGNLVGAESVMARALRNLDSAEASLPTVDLPSLRAQLEDWLAYLERAQASGSSQDGATPIHRFVTDTGGAGVPRAPTILLRAKSRA